MSYGHAKRKNPTFVNKALLTCAGWLIFYLNNRFVVGKVMADNTEILEKIKSLTNQERGELVKGIEEAFGVHACRPIAKYSEEWYRRQIIIDYFPEEEPEKEFDVILEEVPVNKRISVLKILREITGQGLAVVKELIDSVPQTVKSGISASVAEELKAKLEAAGGYVSVK